MPDTVLITGASSGIGKALAIEFSRRGYALGLCARRLELLESLQQEIGKNHAIEVAQLDVLDYQNVKEVFFKLAEKLGGAKIIIANAGICEKSLPGECKFDLERKVIEINLLGAMATIDAGVEIQKKHGGGQIVGISSVAGFRGLSNVPAYSASKSALSTYMEGIRHHLRKHKIAVTVINPGFIDTAINTNRKFRPFLISAEKCARLTADMIEKKVMSSTVPLWPWALVSGVIKFIPERIWCRFKT